MDRIQSRRLVLVAFLAYAITAELANAEWDTYQGNPAHTGYVAGTFDITHAIVQWKTNFGDVGDPSLAIGNNTVLVSHGYASSLAVDQSTGTPLWTNNTVDSPPAYSNGAFYMRTYNRFLALDARTGIQNFSAAYDTQGVLISIQRHIKETSTRPVDTMVVCIHSTRQAETRIGLELSLSTTSGLRLLTKPTATRSQVPVRQNPPLVNSALSIVLMDKLHTLLMTQITRGSAIP